MPEALAADARIACSRVTGSEPTDAPPVAMQAC
jgi:hypothetical protein